MTKTSIRRVQRVGSSSYSVVLPKEWVERAGLGPQSSVIIEDRGWELAVLPGHGGDQRPSLGYEIKVSERTDEEMAVRMMLSAYLAGADVISATSEEGALPVAIKSALKEAMSRYAIGFEVVEESMKGISFQELAGSPTISYRDLLKRMHKITEEMLRASLRAVKGDREASGFVQDSDSEVDRFYLYGMRALVVSLRDSRAASRFGVERPEELVIVRGILKSIERIADHAVALASLCCRLKRPPEIGELERMALEAFNLAYRASSELDMESASAVFSLVKRVRGLGEEGEGALVLEHVKRVVEYSADIAEGAIDMAAIKGLRPLGQ